MSIRDHRDKTINRFLRNAAALAAGGIVAQVALIFVEVIIARDLGAATYGIFATTLAFTTLAMLFVDFGSTWWTIQEGARDPAKLPSLLGNSLVLKILTFVLLFSIALVAVFLSPVPHDVRVFVSIFGLYALGMTIQDSLSAVYAAKQEMHVNGVFQASSPVAILVIYMVLSANGLTLTDVAIAYVSGAAVVAMIWYVWTSSRMKIKGSIRKSIQLGFDSYHYGLTGILRQILYKTDVVMIAFIAGVAEAGIYAAAMKFVELFNKIPVLLGRVVSPALFSSSHNLSAGNYESLVSGYSRLLASIGAGAALITFLMAENLVAFVFGPEYSSSAPILKILSLAMASKCMMTVSEAVLSSLDRHMERWSLLGFAVVFNIVLNVILIPQMGGIGAAIATIISGVTLIVLYVVRGFGRSRVAGAAGWFGIPAILAIAIAGVMSAIGLSTSLAVPISAAAFIGMLLLTRIVKLEEITDIRDSIFVSSSSHQLKTNSSNRPPSSLE